MVYTISFFHAINAIRNFIIIVYRKKAITKIKEIIQIMHKIKIKMLSKMVILSKSSSQSK